MKSIFDLFDVKKIKNIAIVTHQNGDPDAICGAAALQELIRKKNSKLKCMILSDKCTDVVTNLIKKLNLKVELSIPDIKFDLFILFDVNNHSLLGKFADLIKPDDEIIIIDHHSLNPKMHEITSKYIIEQDFSSATEIVHDQFMLNNIEIDKKTAQLLLLGIAFDSGHFKRANNETLKKVVTLTDLGASIDDIQLFLVHERPYSEKIARIKAAQRSQLEKLDKWIILFSNISSFEASGARFLLEMGADAAFVIAQEKENVRVSCRATSRFKKGTNINLGQDIMTPLGEFIGGIGGGHASAAACRGNKNAKKIISKIISLLKEKIKKSGE